MFVKSFTETDANKNVYIGGATVNGSGDYDMLLSKYDPRGVLLWTQQYGGAGNGDDGASAICFGDSGNVYVTGTVYTSNTNLNDCVVLKYDKNGNLKWLQTFNGTASNLDAGTDICIDANYNVYVGGTCTQTGTLQDFLVLKYDKYGQLLWNNSYNGIGMMDISNKISLNDGVVIVAGGTQTNPTKWEYAITKFLQTTGAFSSVTTTNSSGNGIDKVTDLVTDQDGNIYVTGGIVNAGTGYDYHTVKLDSNLVVQWAATYNGNDDLDDMANAIEIDAAGHVFVTGYSTTTNQGTDIVTIRYSSTGTQQGIHTYNDHDNGDDSGEDMLIDDSGNVYISGYAFNGSNLDYHTFKLQSNATLIWEIDYNGLYNNNDKAMDMCLDDDGDIIVVGQCDDGEDEFSFITIKYIEKDITMPPDTENVSSAISFIENKGQLLKTDSTVASTIKYYSQTSNPAFYFANENYHMVLSEFDEATDTIQYCRVDVLLHEINPKTKVYPLNRRSDYTNYYLAHIPEGRARVGNFEQLVYPDIYAGIDLMQTSNNAGWKFYYIIKPNGNPTNIEFSFAGNDSIYISNNNLIIETALGNITYPEADAYQISSTGTKINLSWNPQYSISGSTVNFTLGSYDSSKPLVIEVKQGLFITSITNNGNLEWCTKYGGQVDDHFLNNTTNHSNKLWIIGTCEGGSFPVTQGCAFGYIMGSGHNMVLLNFEQTGQRNWATYYGGSDNEGQMEDMDSEAGIAVNNSDDCFISFMSESDDIPTQKPYLTSPAFLDENCSLWDPVIAKFDEYGAFIWGTYFGGAGPCTPHSSSHALTIDNNNNLYVTGLDIGIELVNPILSNNNIMTFIAKFNSDCELIWSTYFGGTSEDRIKNIVIDSNNDLIITGWTKSTDFPVSQPAAPYTNAYYQSTFGGGNSDAFIAKFVNDSPVWVTYIGGSGDDKAHGLCIDSYDNYYLAGVTTSSDFPVFNGTSYNWYQGNYAGDAPFYMFPLIGDGFFAKLSNFGEQLHTTYYGDIENEGFSDIQIDNYGQICIIGATKSSNIPFASPNFSNGYVQSTLQGTSDGIILLFTEDFRFVWSTYFGGIGGLSDEPWAICFTNQNKLYMVGKTAANNNFPIEYDPLAYYQPYGAGSCDGYIARFSIPEIIVASENEIFNNSYLNIFPNPTSETLIINSQNSNIFYDIYNISGKHLQSGKYDKSINIKNLKQGVYLLKVKINNKIEIHKFIVTK